MRAIIIGGSGLLGSATAERLVAAGHDVTLVGRRPDPRPGGAALARTAYVSADLDHLDAGALSELLRGHDWLVYALGPDDREPVSESAADYFATRLVDRTARLLDAAREAGVRASVVMGSYFTAWAREHPGFADHHPYVAARLRQAEAAVAAGGDTMAVTILEIPYVFGVRPGHTPQWKALIYEPTRRLPLLPLPVGGTSAAALDTVADTALAALERGRHGARYPVGDDDISWRAFLGTALAMLHPGTRFTRLPQPVAEVAARLVALVLRLRGTSSGLDPAWLMRDLLYADVHVDHAATRAELGIARRDVYEAVRATVRASYPERFPLPPHP